VILINQLLVNNEIVAVDIELMLNKLNAVYRMTDVCKIVKFYLLVFC
jgi:hypothetical protein